MVLYLYSTVTGTFVMNTSFRVVDSLPFKERDITTNAVKLSKGEWLEEEKALARKHGHKLFYLGAKTAQLEGISCTAEHEKLMAALTKIAELSDIRATLRTAGISITRYELRASVKPDTLVIQAVDGIAELDRAINILAKRLREWYELYCPEFSHRVRDHQRFVELILEKKKPELMKEMKITAEDGMGAALSEHDLEPIMRLAKQIHGLSLLRDEQSTYIDQLMKKEFPNVYAITGSQIGAKLVSLAGSFERLSRMPASTIQLLGAEEALFRHLKTGAKSPKHGIIHEHPLISQAKASERGRVARALADKIAIAARVDFFKGKAIGHTLLNDLERRFKRR